MFEQPQYIQSSFSAAVAVFLDDAGNPFSFAAFETSTDEELMDDGFPFYVPGEWSEPALESLRKLLWDGTPE